MDLGVGLDNDEAAVLAYTEQEREDLAYKLLASLPRARLVHVHRKIAPFLQIDIIGLLPAELALHILCYLPFPCLLGASRVSRRWRALAGDQSLWKGLCHSRGWHWKDSPPLQRSLSFTEVHRVHPHDDEGVGDDEFDDSGFALLSQALSCQSPAKSLSASPQQVDTPDRSQSKPDYMLLYQTRVLLHNRLLNSSYRLSTLQSRDTPNSHTSTVYCLQLFTLPDGRQVLFTGSRDTSVRQWDLSRGAVEKVLDGVHEGSVLSLCAHGNFFASAGGDGIVVVWDIATGKVVKILNDHTDSVLCVRFDDRRLVSCSKDRTVRSYLFPELKEDLVLASHRAAVNAVSISAQQIVSASGDRSVILWDAETGAMLQCFEGHHMRGIASIDFAPPYIVTGSSDKHVRLFDWTDPLRGWCTNPSMEPQAVPLVPLSPVCETCGGDLGARKSRRRRSRRKQHEAHTELVRTVALGDEVVLSGSYDQTVKVWDRKTGNLLADLSGGHMGRVLCVGFDCTKIVSCGEDQKILIWDFAHGNVDTSFVKL